MLSRLQEQAAKFGRAELAHAAASVSESLSSMTGATSPKLHLELMCAKILVPAANATEVGSLARIERLERRIGIAGDAPVAEVPAPVAAPVVAEVSAPALPASNPTTPITVVDTGVAISQVRSSWQRILDQVAKKSKKAYMVAYTIDVMAVEGDVLTLRFASNYDLESFKGEVGAPDVLRKAIQDEFGIVFKFKPMMEATPAPTATPVTAPMPVVAAVVAEEVLAEPELEEPEEEAPEAQSRNSNVDEDARYGESLLREILGAEPLDD
jgi:DNA polymerase-3 subunit gamma/tau